MIRNVATLLLRNYFPDDIKAGIVFTSKWKWDGCNERVRRRRWNRCNGIRRAK